MVDVSDLLAVFIHPRQLAVGAAVYHVGKVIRVPPLPVSDRAGVEILPLFKLITTC